MPLKQRKSWKRTSGSSEKFVLVFFILISFLLIAGPLTEIDLVAKSQIILSNFGDQLTGAAISIDPVDQPLVEETPIEENTAPIEEIIITPPLEEPLCYNQTTCLNETITTCENITSTVCTECSMEEVCNEECTPSCTNETINGVTREVCSTSCSTVCVNQTCTPECIEVIEENCTIEIVESCTVEEVCAEESVELIINE
ncbi:MAG: hypothetical protein KJ597_01220, partial [Nanoarchaeota archaeon]|nr:hypothetical protein [Nanoarchaeota archaeon]